MKTNNNSCMFMQLVALAGALALGKNTALAASDPSPSPCGVNGGGAADAAFSYPGAGPNGAIRAVAVQRDGKVLIGGDFTAVGPWSCFHLARLNQDGSVDTSFTYAQNSILNGTFVSSVVVQANGGIIIGGDFTSPRRYVARLHRNGTWDNSFNGSGSQAPLAAVVNVVTLDGDDNVLVGDDGGDIVRLLPHGGWDTTFRAQANDPIYAIVVQPDGQLIIGGEFTYINNNYYPYLARLSGQGALDRSFRPAPDGEVIAVALQSDGDILFGGDLSSVGGVSRSRIARVSNSGSLDNTFTATCNWSVRSLVLQSDGGIVVGGLFSRVCGMSRYGLARLFSSGAIDPSFDATTMVADGRVNSLVLGQDCTIVAGGSFTTGGGSAFNRIARIKNY